MALLKKEKWKFKPYSFIDYYFTRGTSLAKVREWDSPHVPKTEIIFFTRKDGLKTEKSKPSASLRIASRKLMSLGFEPYLKIVKKKAWLISKRGMPTYAFEYVPGLGWTGEIEVPPTGKRRISGYVARLKRMGATRFTEKPMLELMEKRLMALRAGRRSRL